MENEECYPERRENVSQGFRRLIIKLVFHNFKQPGIFPDVNFADRHTGSESCLLT